MIHRFSVYFQLDNLSRDDLTKFVKKQMLLLQKTRAKCDGKFLLFALYECIIILKKKICVYRLILLTAHLYIYGLQYDIFIDLYSLQWIVHNFDGHIIVNAWF